MYTVGLYTLGCKVSQYETEAIAEEFARAGFTVLPFEDACDVYVINTCTVTAESDRKSRQMIRRAIHRAPGAVVCVTGCYSQTSPAAVAAMEGVDIVIGSDKKLSLVKLAAEKLEERDRGAVAAPVVSVGNIDEAAFEPMRITHAPRTRAYVKIEDGCECRCTYCEIPNARGRVRSKTPADVIAEVEALYRGGTREIVLTGIETASYGADFAERYRLADLIEELDRRHSCDRVRLGSLSPEVMTADFMSRIGRLSILVPHFHLSMQSGADAVLRRMKRRYNRTMALQALTRAREAIPDVQFTTDLMVGFPGETDADFDDTLRFVGEARFLDAHVFAYSRRPGTPAADYPDQVPEDVKRERSARLIAEKNRVRDEVLTGLVREGKPLSVVMETKNGNTYTSHADTFVEVHVSVPDGAQDLHGKILSVVPVSHKDGHLIAEIDNNTMQNNH